MVLGDVRGVRKDSPLTEISTIVTFTRLCRASPRTSLQISSCFMLLVCEIVLSVDTGVIQPSSSTRWEKMWGYMLWLAAAWDNRLVLPCSSWCQADKTTSSFVELLHRRGWRGCRQGQSGPRAASISCSIRAHLADEASTVGQCLPGISSLVS